MADGSLHSYDAPSAGQGGAIIETLSLFRKEKVLLGLVLLFAFGVGATVWKLGTVGRELVTSFALGEARTYSETLSNLHRIYSVEVLERTRHLGVVAASDYADREDAIPLPLTFNALMERPLAETRPGLRFEIYSDYPFSWRQRTPAFSGAFSREALVELASNPSGDRYRFEESDGAPVLRYAKALVMEESCVHCHNTYPRTPRTDWKTGDFAGVLEVLYPVDAAASSTVSGVRFASQLVLGATLLGCVAIALVVSRLRRVSTDLNEEVEARTAELRASEARFEEISNSIDEVFWVYETATESIIFVSPAFDRIWGYARHELLADASRWRDSIQPEDRDQVTRDFQQQAAQGAYEQQYRIVRPDATVRWIEERAYPVRDPSGTVPRIVGISEDITARKETEARLKTLHQQLVEASRVAGMAEVATGVLHNVGNVLNSINVSTARAKELLHGSRVGRLQEAVALLRDTKGEDLERFMESTRGKALTPFLTKATNELAKERAAVASELDVIDQQLQHVVSVVVAQQTFAQGTVYAEDVNLPQLVDDAVRIEDAALRKLGIQVVRRYECSPNLFTEKHKLFQILVNLVGNAKDALETRTSAPRSIRLRIHSEEDIAYVTVEDTGVGIAPDHLSRLFEYGFTTKKNGHGFGLHASVNSALELGGSLRAESAGPGRGASFVLELPLTRKEEETVCTT